MGFYHPSTLVKDAQRHGLRVRPVDIMQSEWQCTLEPESSPTMWDISKGARLQPRRTPVAPSAALAAEGTRIPSNNEVPQGLKPLSKSKLSGTAEAVPFQTSDLSCRLEGLLHLAPRFALRLGFRYARGLREEAAQAIVRERRQRPFASIADFGYRVPEVRRNEMVLLASIGALNSIGGKTKAELPPGLKPLPENELNGTAEAVPFQTSDCRPEGLLHPAQQPSASGKQRLHRRDALWQVERAARFAGPLLDGIPESDTASPLAPMTAEERLVADFHGTGLTTGPHPMAYRRAELRRARVLSAKELTQVPNGRRVRTAGCIIARQRPGTAKGFVFLSLEDETGISNAIITPDILEQNRVVIVSEKFVLLEGVLQNQDGVISVRVERIAPMREAYAAKGVDVADAEVRSHDFH